jgi:hypothetical protein
MLFMGHRGSPSPHVVSQAQLSLLPWHVVWGRVAGTWPPVAVGHSHSGGRATSPPMFTTSGDYTWGLGTTGTSCTSVGQWLFT